MPLGSVASGQAPEDDSDDTCLSKSSKGMVWGKCKSIQRELLAFVNLTKCRICTKYERKGGVLSWFLWQYGPAVSTGTSIRGGGEGSGPPEVLVSS